MTLHEPATFVTDLLLAALSGWLASRLQPTQPALRKWRLAFAFTSAAALSGGVYHGLGPEMAPVIAAALWRITLLSIVATSLCMAQAGGHACLSERSNRLIQKLAWTKAAVFASWVLVNPIFVSAIADYGSTMLLLLCLELQAWRRHRVRHAAWITSGIAISALAALVQQTRWSIHHHFNHNDLYHVIQALALGMFFRGARISGNPQARPLNRS